MTPRDAARLIAEEPCWRWPQHLQLISIKAGDGAHLFLAQVSEPDSTLLESRRTDEWRVLM